MARGDTSEDVVVSIPELTGDPQIPQRPPRFPMHHQRGDRISKKVAIRRTPGGRHLPTSHDPLTSAASVSIWILLAERDIHLTPEAIGPLEHVRGHVLVDRPSST